MRLSLKRIIFASVFAALLPAESTQAASPKLSLEESFRNPPYAAKPWVFWYWMSASSSRVGITADLEAMKEAGIGGAHLVPIKGVAKPPLITPVAEQFGPEWWDHVKFALSEADRLGLRIAMHASDGYATAGGPWVTPEASMQKVVWTTTPLEGGRRVDLVLPQPETNENFYRDISVVAFPAWADGGKNSRDLAPHVTSSKAGVDAQFLAQATNQVFTSDQPGWVQFAFAEPFTCRSITIHIPPTKGIQFNTYHANRLAVEVSEDGEHFRKITQLTPPRHGWQDGDGDVTHAIPATTAKIFRFVYDPAGAEPGAEDVDAAKWKPVLRLRGVELSSEPRVHHFEGKSGQSWRISPVTTTEQLPTNLCVPLKRIVKLTDRVGRDGHLVWDVPPGRWIVLRLGHTSTGFKNDTGGAMMGLECDKFDPAAARLVFDRWFGEVIRQAGPLLAGHVLKVLHVDSWECGSQNWSPVFREEFQRRRGYDPLPYLPVMAGVPVESADASERFLHDMRETIAELVKDNFFGPLEQLAKAHGCTFSAECVAPVMLCDGLGAFGTVDTPMGEFWLRSPTHDKLNDMLDAISGAHIYGKSVVQAEAFTELQIQWDESPSMLKALGDRNYALGANRFVYHVFTHNPWLDRKPGMTLGGTGHYFQRDQTWWRPGFAWVRYAQRCQALLQEGAPVVDIAVFTGDDTPSRAVVPWHLAKTLPGYFPAGDARLSKKIVEAGDWIDPLRGYAYDSINRDALLRLAEVRNGRIELSGGASYAMLIVPVSNPMMPAADAMTPEVAARLRALVKAGATVVLGERPQHSPSLSGGVSSDESVQHSIDKLWPKNVSVGAVTNYGHGRVFGGAYDGSSFERLGLAPDVTFSTVQGARADGVAWTHRAGPSWDLYFISNQQNEPREIAVSFRVNGRVPELWDAVNGETRVAGTWTSDGTRTVLPVQLPANGSVFVVFQKASLSRGEKSSKNWNEPVVMQELRGKWHVSFDPAFGGPQDRVEFARLESWTARAEKGVRNYSGTARYTCTFEWPATSRASHGRVWLELGEVADLAEVTVNGAVCGVAWTAPYRVEVTSALREGENELCVDVTNTWFNRLAGDRDLPEAERLTRTTAPDRTAGKPLRRAGLFGPVTLLSEPVTP